LSARRAGLILPRGGNLTRRNRNVWVQLLSLALFMAQWGMLAHASTHLKADPHAGPAKTLCGECLSFAPLQNIVGGAPAVVIATKPHAHLIDDLVSLAVIPPSPFDAFRSRAPPILL
jgi:hypothetical protein